MSIRKINNMLRFFCTMVEKVIKTADKLCRIVQMGE